MADLLDPTAALLALLVDVRDRKVLHDEDQAATYLDLPDGERADVEFAMAAAERAGWAWLPADTPVWRLTDKGREVLDRGAV